MVQRRPPGVPYESWVDRQVRQAVERGAFDGLEGAGRPLDAERLGHGASETVVEWARREGADLSAALPPALALRLEREQLVEAVPSLPSEAVVRARVEAFNERLDAAYRRPQVVPPVSLAFVGLERQLDRWRAARPAPVEQPDADPPPAPSRVPGRRRWRRLGRRGPRP